MKNYTKSPLPFQGQKRGWYNTFTSLINLEFSQTETFIDLFGGSGILSQFVRQVRPDARVVWNDYDNFFGRLQSIPQTNEIIKRLRYTCRNYKPMQRLDKDTAQKCIDIAKEAEDITTAGKSVCFSSNFIKSINDLKPTNMYNNIVSTEYDAIDYLNGVERRQTDYRELIKEFKDKDVCFVCDPPYLTTNSEQYRYDYWKLTDYLEVISNLKNEKFIYFTSEKSQLVELMTWCEKEYGHSLLTGAQIVSRETQLAYNSRFKDLLIYKNEL